MRDLLAGECNGELNIHSRSRDESARRLSPLFNRPFELCGAMFASFEGFFNGIKFPEYDPRRRRAFTSCYGHAQRFGDQAQQEWAWWLHAPMRLGSRAHRMLVTNAHYASILQDRDRRDALLHTAGLVLMHETGTPPDPHYPPELFAETSPTCAKSCSASADTTSTARNDTMNVAEFYGLCDRPDATAEVVFKALLELLADDAPALDEAVLDQLRYRVNKKRPEVTVMLHAHVIEVMSHADGVDRVTLTKLAGVPHDATYLEIARALERQS